MHTTTVTQISNKTATTKFGPKPTFSFKGDDGEWYSLGFKKPTFVVGDEVKFEFASSAYGNQVQDGTLSVAKKGMTKMPDSKPATQQGQYAKPFPIPALHGDRAIIRQNALTNAREIMVAAHGGHVGAFTVDINDFAEDIIALARKFEAYSAGDLDLAKATKRMEEDSEE